MILILTNKQDTHADAAIRALGLRGVDVFRLNSEDIVAKYEVHLELGGNGLWRGEIGDEIGRKLDLARLRVAWLRKPVFDFTGESYPETKAFVASEATALVNAIYGMPGVTWVNDPFAANKAKVKFQQLVEARKLGMKTPNTLITNDPERAEEFFVSNGGEMVLTKSIHAGNVIIHGVNQGISSKKVFKNDFYESYENIAICPTLLQNYVDKQFELRVTVIKDAVYAVRIDSQVHEETRVDWRVRTDLNPLSNFDLPPEVSEFCVKFLKHQGLLFGAMDFVVTPDNEYVFLENNPSGQYLWLELATGAPITDGMCDLLTSYLD